MKKAIGGIQHVRQYISPKMKTRHLRMDIVLCASPTGTEGDLGDAGFDEDIDI